MAERDSLRLLSLALFAGLAAWAAQHVGWAWAVAASAAFAVWVYAVAAVLAADMTPRAAWFIFALLLGPVAALIVAVAEPWSTRYPRKRTTLIRIFTYAVLTILGTAFTLPFFWLVVTSFKPASRIQRWPPDIIPMVPVRCHIDGKTHKVYRVTRPTSGLAKDARVAVLKRLGGGQAIVRRCDAPSAPPVRASTDDLEEAVRPGLALSNYSRGLTFIPFARQLRNTLIICGFAVLGTLLSCSLVAYGLARIEWRGRGALFIVILSTMMLPYQVIMVPMFAIFVWLGWVDSFLPLTVPAFFGNAFFIFLLRQFFLTIPRDLSEAAKLDGCGEFDIYRCVILPLSKPALAMVGLWTFMGAWNDFLGPLIYLVSESSYTLSLGLAMFLGQYGSEYGMLMAVSTVVTVPIIIIFFFTQRTFIQGITMTGIKA